MANQLFVACERQLDQLNSFFDQALTSKVALIARSAWSAQAKHDTSVTDDTVVLNGCRC